MIDDVLKTLAEQCENGHLDNKARNDVAILRKSGKLSLADEHRSALRFSKVLSEEVETLRLEYIEAVLEGKLVPSEKENDYMTYMFANAAHTAKRVPDVAPELSLYELFRSVIQTEALKLALAEVSLRTQERETPTRTVQGEETTISAKYRL